MDTSMRIAVFVTGGTFDKEYNELNGELFFKKTHVKEMLEMGRSKVSTRVETLMMKDSLVMTDEDRAQIAKSCKAAKELHILITHGTDTMVATAQSLRGIEGKTIVLTGALQPGRFADSDAAFNLGLAFGAVQLCPPGVYVVANGAVFPADRVRKNLELNRFEAL